MTVEKVDAGLSDFDAHFDRLFASPDAASDGKVKLLLFLADRKPDSSLSWCPGKPRFSFCSSRGDALVPYLPTVVVVRRGRLQRGGAGDLRAAGGTGGQGRGAPARLRRGQAHLARPGAPVEGGPQVRAQGRANADPLGGWRRRRPPRGRRGAPQGQG
jgi:hypothetical protein